MAKDDDKVRVIDSEESLAAYLASPEYKQLVADVKVLGAELKRLSDEGVARGEFPDDRGMLECLRCGLWEDIAPDNQHLVYFKYDDEHDTGLRFIPTDNPAVFLCPNCNSKTYDPDRTEN